MGFYSRLADRLILQPSRDHIETSNKKCTTVSFRDGRRHFEIWSERFNLEPGGKPEALLIKFPGTGGRAERSTVHPAEFWPAKSEIWTINPPGYGKSLCSARLSNISEMIDLVHNHVMEHARSLPCFLVSNSLGSIYAFLYATRFIPAGLVVRNPVPLREIVRSRKKSWHPNWILKRIIDAIPDELDNITNAANVQSPSLFITSSADTVIPVHLQQLIFDAYSGERKQFMIQNGDHEDPPARSELDRYRESLQWIYDRGIESWQSRPSQ